MAKIKTTKPEMGPGDSSGSAESEKISMPSEIPPEGVESLESAGGTVMITSETGGSTPTLPISGGVGVEITAWQNNKKINALWCICENRNSWIGVQGIGWKKLADNSDSAIVALTKLSAHAFEKGSVVNYREESDAKIHEMYVW